MTEMPLSKQFFALALDPIHVGTGGYRLGRVDMSIVREPGTNLPKIPGTSISGVCRTYATMQHPEKWPHCAGQGQADDERGYNGHCGKADCLVCVTFGFAKGDGAHSFQGLAQFSDARLVLFPVHSLAGPVWVTCPDTLSVLKVPVDDAIGDETALVADGVQINGKLNLGWLMLAAKNGFSLQEKLPNVPEEIKEVLNRTVLVSNRLFGQIVNDNLEVRTSVSIDPSTGAAADGALFTYEALPRGSVLALEVVVSDPKYYRIDGKIPLDGEIQKVKDTVQEGLKLIASLGIGGMNTRGMGRMRVWEAPGMGDAS